MLVFQNGLTRARTLQISEKCVKAQKKLITNFSLILKMIRVCNVGGRCET